MAVMIMVKRTERTTARTQSPLTESAYSSISLLSSSCVGGIFPLQMSRRLPMVVVIKGSV